MNVIVCGSRKVYDKELFKHVYTNFEAEFDSLMARGMFPDLIVHGDCPNSPDLWGAEFAEREGIRVEAYPANWEGLGKHAGHFRNAMMAKYVGMLPDPNLCIAVWDGKSPGTLNMIKEAVKKQIPVNIIPATI